MVEFGSTEDRDYYVKSDPAHADFVEVAKRHWEKALVVDFHPGKFS